MENSIKKSLEKNVRNDLLGKLDTIVFQVQDINLSVPGHEFDIEELKNAKENYEGAVKEAESKGFKFLILQERYKKVLPDLNDYISQGVKKWINQLEKKSENWNLV